MNDNFSVSIITYIFEQLVLTISSVCFKYVWVSTCRSTCLLRVLHVSHVFQKYYCRSACFTHYTCFTQRSWSFFMVYTHIWSFYVLYKYRQDYDRSTCFTQIPWPFYVLILRLLSWYVFYTKIIAFCVFYTHNYSRSSSSLFDGIILFYYFRKVLALLLIMRAVIW